MKKDKLFYVALAVGLLTLCSALVLYNKKTTQQENGQLIDLNEEGNLTKNEKNKEENSEDIASVLETDKKGKRQSGESTESGHEGSKENAAGTLKENDSETDDQNKQPETDGQRDSSLSYAGEQSMIWPVEGNVLLPFSMETTIYFKTMDQYQCNPGMLIEAKKGTVVKAAEDGIVKSVSKDDKLGNLLEVTLGNGYTMTYGQIEDITVKEGDRIVKGTQIASVAAPTRFYEKEGAHIYLAVKKDGEPFDPLTVLTD